MDSVFQHYSELEKEHIEEVGQPQMIPLPSEPTRKLKINAEDLLENGKEDELLLLTNFSISQFNELYEGIQQIVEHRIHSDSMVSPKTRFLMTLVYCKFDEPWRKFSLNFGINFSYAQKIVLNFIKSTKDSLVKNYINWISVSERITKFNLHIDDFPTLVGSLDATVQRISRPGQNQKAYYSGKHKYHCVKTQAFVSPTGFLIHFSKTVEGKIHDFNLFKQSDLDSKLINENNNCRSLFGNDCISLADSGYQGISKLLPFFITPFKKPRRGQLSPEKVLKNKTISKHRIIVENWFGRLKILWRIMSIAYNLDLETYSDVWQFCAALTNFHIANHPLRKLEPGVNLSLEEEEEEEEAEDENSD